jgi:PTS system cellobiose-specific IIC component
MQEEKRNGFMTFMEERFIPVAARIGTERHLLAMRDGVVMMMPLLIIGAFSMVIAEFPNQAFQDFMASTFGEDWNAFEGIIMNATYGIAALVACFGSRDRSSKATASMGRLRGSSACPR